MMKEAVLMRELRNVRHELEWLLWCEQRCNPDWRFTPMRYSKRRARLVRTYWALEGLQARK